MRKWIRMIQMLLMACILTGCKHGPQQITVTDITEEPTKNMTEVPIKVTENILTIRDISSKDLVQEMKTGWNLGNTLDATGGMGIMSESSWGNPITKKEMILMVKEAGFNVVRIPVSWAPHMVKKAPYTIHDKWLERVKEVVDYAYEEGMYVILNMHHEDWITPYYDKQEIVKEQLVAAWTQIAEYFKAYDERLIFEGMNEPRMIGTTQEWNGGNQEGWDVINYLDQAFVETVRGTGGNNMLRHLMIPGYAASSNEMTLKAIEIPDDDKVIISVHSYSPYNFALNKSGTSEFDSTKKSDTKEIDSLAASIKKLFLDKGVAVIIGEYGCMNKENLSNRVDCAKYFTDTMKAIGVPCCWWDNNAFNGSGENFGLLNRRELTWEYPKIVEAITKNEE